MWCNVVSLDVGDWMMHFLRDLASPTRTFLVVNFAFRNSRKWRFSTLLGRFWIGFEVTQRFKEKHETYNFCSFLLDRSNGVDLHWNQIIKIRDFSAKIQENSEFYCQPFLFYKISYSVRYLNIKNSIEFISKLIT